VDEDAVDGGVWYTDDDRDGWGLDEGVAACEAPEGTADQEGDCDDGDDSVHPNADEVCNGVDDDCDDLFDESAADAVTWYVDADGDGYGAGDASSGCGIPSGHVAYDGDCDDSEATTYPGRDEWCHDGVDNDCDDVIDACDQVVYELADATYVAGTFDADRAGSSLATGDLDGDGVGDLLVGSPGYEGAGRGAAHVVLGTAGLPAWLYYDESFTLMGDGEGELLGTDVALGDYDGDLLDEIVIGAPGVSSVGTGGSSIAVGEVVLWDDDTKAWAEGGFTARAYADGRITGEASTSEFGFSVSVLAADAGEEEDLLVGAPLFEWKGDVAGAACVYEGGEWGASSWDSAELCVIGPTTAESWLGWDVEGRADVIEGDGLSDVVVGGPYATYDASADRGVVVAVDGSASSLVNAADAAARLYGAPGDELGTTLRAAGDLNADGYHDLVLGAPAAGDSTGSVYVVLGPLLESSPVSDAAVATITGSQALDRFGEALASDDFGGDDHNELVIGAPQAERSGMLRGEAYLFQGPVSGSWSADDASVLFEAEGLAGRAGYALETGHLDDDGVPEVLIGVPYASYDGEQSGGFYAIWSEELF